MGHHLGQFRPRDGGHSADKESRSPDAEAQTVELCRDTALLVPARQDYGALQSAMLGVAGLIHAISLTFDVFLMCSSQPHSPGSALTSTATRAIDDTE